MAPRASWKGFLNLSLVSVPVKAYTASNSGSQVRLNQLCSKCHSRIKQKVHCPVCGDLERSELVKGYEYAKDQYVVIDLEELQKLRAENEDRAIKIDTFISPEEIDPIYYSESSYYLLPDGTAGQKPYALFHRVMEEKDLCCVAHVVLHNREQMVLVRPKEGMLCMTILRYANQVKAASSFEDELVETAVSDAEFELAETLINETTTKEFDLESFRDQYTERLTKLIEAKVNGEEVVESPAAESPNVINLMEALKASVAKAQTKDEAAASSAGQKPDRGAARKGTRKKAAAAKTGELKKQLSKPKKKSSRKKQTG